MGRTDAIPSWLRRTGIELLGCGLIAVGLAALVLPGPGLLALAGGLVVLSLRYAWAKRLLVPIKVEALKIVEKEVQTWPRIVASALGGLAAIAAGILWGVRPPMPDWWTFGDRWWLPGSWFVGSTLIVSGVVALALMSYSFRKFRRPRASSHRGGSSP